MTDKEVLLDLVQFYADDLHPTISGMSLDVLRWQPDPGANNIAVTVWHVARLLDDLWTRAFDNRPAEDQVWMAGGWSTRTGYDPRGIGWHGSGMLFEYTRQEVDEVPILSADDLLAYFDQVNVALRASLEDMPDAALHRRAPRSPVESWTPYRIARLVLMNAYEHLGEIKALKAMWERKVASPHG